MADRYYSATPIEGPTTKLTGSEAHHVLHVMRAQPGTTLIVFDGLGGEYEAEVIACSRSEVELRVGERLQRERELPWQLTLAVALPKGERQRWLVEKAVELGVTKLVPLQTLRSDLPAKGQSTHKLSRYVIAASKQCGRNRLMEIAPAVPWAHLVRQATPATCFLAHPSRHPLGPGNFPAADLQIAVGPAGGFTEEEVAQAMAAGWQTIQLGNRILRTETAAIMLASVAAWGRDPL